MEKDERKAPMTTTRTRFIFDSKLTPAALQPSQIRRPSGAASVPEVLAPSGDLLPGEEPIPHEVLVRLEGDGPADRGPPG